MNGDFMGINRKIQIKPIKIEKDSITGKKTVSKALFILKWGGEITHSGLKQAEEFGKFFRENFYINCNEGLLRLHSTYRHDFKVYSADEGRCQRTAAAFAKGLLMIDDDLTPILSSFVNSDDSAVKMLDVSKSISMNETITKHDKKLHSLFVSSTPIKENIYFNNKQNEVIINNPLETLKEIDNKLSKLCIWIQNHSESTTNTYYLKPNDRSNKIDSNFCSGDTSILIYKRYMKLVNDFFDDDTEEFNLSKLPDILDSLR